MNEAKMTAVTNTRYGTHEVMESREKEKPSPGPRDILIRIHAVSLNSSDKEFLTGRPGYVRLFSPFRPSLQILGSDITGIVEKAGPKVTRFKPGDRIMADMLMKGGGLAEYVCIPEKKARHVPDDMDFITASTLLQAGDVAWQGIITRGRIGKGRHVLINGSGGASGSLAIQLAKNAGAAVTAVDNTGKLEFMKSLGADHVIDYTREDFTENRGTYDLILDLVATHPLRHYRRALAPGGRYYIVGGYFRNILKTVLFGSLWSLLSSRKTRMLLVKTGDSTEYVLRAVQEGSLYPVIGHTFPLEQAAEGMRLLVENRALGKVVITVDSNTTNTDKQA